MLSEGPKPAKAEIKEARDAGIAERTLARAKSKLKVESRKGGNGWEWLLPAEKASRAQSAKVGALESTEAYKQHTINNIGKDAKTAKNATLEGAAADKLPQQPKRRNPSPDDPVMQLPYRHLDRLDQTHF